MKWFCVSTTLGLACLFTAASARAQEPQSIPATRPSRRPAAVWRFGAFVDAGYLLDFNHPANRVFRSRGTTPRVDEPRLNMAAIFLRKEASEKSRWGLELTLQTGEDAKVFGFSATAPNFPGANWLRHLGPSNVSYLAPVGKGLTIQGGYFNSLIGYDSLYAKNNFSYTRPWVADFTPYLMFGVNAAYPVSDRVTATLFVINGYWHLANANRVPSFGGQLAWQTSSGITFKQTLLIGPHQKETAIEFWRLLSDTILEKRTDRVTVALDFNISSEQVAGAGRSRALWMAAQLPMRWRLDDHWSLAVRPEAAWDRDGRWTLFPQTVKAVTSTLEYRFTTERLTPILRIEHRWDDSRGPAGGFYRGANRSAGVPQLVPSQHLIIAGVIVNWDSGGQP